FATRLRKVIQSLRGIEELAMSGKKLPAGFELVGAERFSPEVQPLAFARAVGRGVPAWRMISHCCPTERRLFQVQYSTKPAGERASTKVKMIGMNWNMRA